MQMENEEDDAHKRYLWTKSETDMWRTATCHLVKKMVKEKRRHCLAKEVESILEQCPNVKTALGHISAVRKRWKVRSFTDSILRKMQSVSLCACVKALFDSMFVILLFQIIFCGFVRHSDGVPSKVSFPFDFKLKDTFAYGVFYFIFCCPQLEY